MAGERKLQSQPEPEKRRIFSFVTPSEPIRISYQQQKQRFAAAMQEHPWFQDGDLLETMEKGVLYPVIHSIEVPSSKHSVPLLRSTELGANFVLQQDVYTEIKEFRPDNEHLLRLSLRPNPDRSIIFVAFKTLDSTFSEVLEDSWKDWTGARQIYLNLPDELGLSRFAFYRKKAPLEASSFVYILTVQCESVPPSNYFQLIDYVHRFRVQKLKGYLSVYRGVPTDLRNGNQRVNHRHLNGLLDHIDEQGTKVDI